MEEAEQFQFISRIYPFLSNIRYIVVGDGKSGTSTVTKSFNLKSKRCIHTHGDGSLRNQYPRLKEKGIVLNTLYKWLHLTTGKKPLVFYTFREPVSRTTSSFFENILANSTPYERASLDMICPAIDRNFDVLESYHCCDFNFFDGFDVYSHEFDKKRGWSLYETEHIRILHLKFEVISTWPDIIASILAPDELQDFTFTSDRLGHLYHDLYLQVKKHFVPSRAKLESLFKIHSKFLDHFYTQDEIDNLKEFWYSRST